MRKPTRKPAVLALLALLATSFFVATPSTANAAEYIPELQWPATDVGRRDNYDMVESTTGSMTLPCSTTNGGQDLVSYSATGQIFRQLPRTQAIDGVPNCIGNLTVDKNDRLYGIPAGTVNGYYTKGPNLLAYDGSALMWKYPLSCGYDTSPSLAVGADGNIYATAWLSDGMHLIGLKPNLDAGQSQPTKVLDVKTPNDCSSQLYAYKDGIMLHGQSSGNPRYYSYSGKYLGQASIGSIWDEKINAEGQLFVRSNITGNGFTSVSISKYDPRTGAVQWTTSASRSGADTSGTKLRPLPNGGVVALIKQQKMVSDGVPASPKEWMMVLVTLDANGQKIRSWELPNTTGQDTFGATYFSSDTNGNITVMRVLNLKTSVSWPTMVPAITVGVYDPMNGAWSNEFVMQGDLQKVGGPSDYWLDTASDEHAITNTNGTLSIVAHCSNNCANNRPMLYPIKVSGLGMAYPRSSVLSRAPRPATPYIALGDSFSAGESVEPFETGTNTPNVNTCHRSDSAYPRLISGTSAKIPSLGSDSFRACGGAVSDNVWSSAQWNEGIQLDFWPNSAAQLVTLTIGGNDIGIRDTITTCAWPANDCNAAFQTANQKVANLGDALKRTYTEVLTKMPNAKVFVIGYPQLFAVGPDCPLRPDYPVFNADRKQKAIDLVNALDAKISTSVNAVRALNQDYFGRLTYINTTGISSPFVGHEICSSDPYFNGLVLQPQEYSFHPNQLGQQAFATIISATINAG